MKIPHSVLCADMRDYCECGSAEIQERLDQLEAEREARVHMCWVVAVERLIRDAETIVIQSTGAPFKPRMVLASDLEDVLAGKLR